jgi:hypothetical protein
LVLVFKVEPTTHVVAGCRFFFWEFSRVRPVLLKFFRENFPVGVSGRRDWLRLV